MNSDKQREAFEQWWQSANTRIFDLPEEMAFAIWKACARQHKAEFDILKLKNITLLSDNEKLSSGIFPEHLTRQFFQVIKGSAVIVGKDQHEQQMAELQRQLDDQRQIHRKYGLWLSAAIRGAKRPDEPAEQGRLDAVRSMAAKVEQLQGKARQVAVLVYKLALEDSQDGYPFYKTDEELLLIIDKALKE